MAIVRARSCHISCEALSSLVSWVCIASIHSIALGHARYSEIIHKHIDFEIK